MERAAPWWPAVDALRGVAVAAVLVHHHDPGLLPGGFLGVSLFFTLSGFLITTLVLREHEATGSIRLRRFWARRLRRLTPVALLGLVLALGVAAVDEPRAQLAESGGDVVAAALDVANWRLAADDVDYGDTLRPPSPVAHYWSLAIEEQFYAVFPVVALVALRRGGRRTLAAAAVAAIGVSLLAQAVVADPNRACLGTDTRMGELAVGALLAVCWSGWSRAGGRGARWLDVGAAAAAGALLLAWRRVELGDPRLFDGGLLVHAVLAAVVVAAAVGGRWAPALGRCRPLVALGRISYAAYVVHFPLFLWLDDAGLAVRVGATLAAATAVHRAVERPVRVGGALRGGRQAPLALAGALGAVLVLAVAVPEAGQRRDGSTLVAADGPTVLTMPAAASPPATPTPTATTAAEPPADAGPPTPATAAPTAAPASPEAPQPAPPASAPTRSSRPPRLLVVGDSTALATGVGMQQWAAATGAATVDVVTHYGCTFFRDGLFRIRDGWVQPPSEQCVALLDSAIDVAAAVRPDAIVLFLGVMHLADWDVHGDGTWRSVGDPVLDDRYRAEAGAALDRLGSLGVPVLWTDQPLPTWVPELSGGLPPGSGPVTVNDPGRLPRLAALVDDVVVTRPWVRVVPYARFLAGPDGTIPPSVRPDGLHVAPAAVPGIMAAGFEAALVAAYRATAGAGAPRTTWSG